MCPSRFTELTVLLCHIYLQEKTVDCNWMIFFCVFSLQIDITFEKFVFLTRKFYKVVVTLIIYKEKSVHVGELYVFVIAVYTSKLFAVHIFYLIS